jgi:hypothetical protein
MDNSYEELDEIGTGITRLIALARDHMILDHLILAKNRVNYLRGGKTVVLLKPESNRQKAQYSKVR